MPRRLAALMLIAAGGVACRTAAPVSQAPASRPPAIVTPGAPGEASTVSTAPGAPSSVPHVKADTEFMQGMIGHHAQALDMVALLETRTESADMKMLALRIKVSQQDEIKFMRRWLEERGEAVPGEHAHHAGDYKRMPGMLSPAEMAKLAAAKGQAFDRLFLEYMINHHDGALVMVDALFKKDGAGQQSDVHAFASDVLADQQMEIDRMVRMWRGLQK